MTNYKPHYACFKCRKTFKRRLLSDIEGKEEFYLKEAKCPECGSLMANMGKDFESPKRENSKEWEHIERLYSVGITFHSCGCTGPGYIPNTTEKLIAYLEGIKEDYNHNLDFWRQRNEPTSKKEVDRDNSKNWNFISQIPNELKPKKGAISKEDAINYWLKRVTEVEQKLATIK
jgi:DNA-directed RNA polymerase subunit RPC12/RpoP